MAQFLRTATPMGVWKSFPFTHSESGVTYTEGQLYLIRDTVGVLLLNIQYTSAGCKKAKTIDVGSDGVLIYNAEKIVVDKEEGTGLTFAPGQIVYWSGTQADPVTPTATSGYIAIGIAVEAAEADDDTVIIDLEGAGVS